MKIFYAILLPLLFIACGTDTVPITTNSDQALKEFLVARDLCDKIQ